jgi:hypothetical protein
MQADFPVLTRTMPIWITSGSPTIHELARFALSLAKITTEFEINSLRRGL